MSLRKFSWRAMWRRPGRTVLTVLSIVIGVAAVVSVTITTTTTRSAYKEMFALVLGKASLVVDGEGGISFDAELRDKVAAVPGVKAAVPVVRRYSVLYAGAQRIRLQVLGVDVARDGAVRDYAITAGRSLPSDTAYAKELLLDDSFARRLKVTVGDEVKLLTKRGLKTVTIAGTLQPRGGAALQQAGLVLLPIDTTQSYFAAKGKIDSIQIVVDDQVEPDTVRTRIAPLLPSGVYVRPPAMHTQAMQETLYSSEKGLQMTTACTLLLAAFIILNTFLMNVSERRRQLSILRAIGATGRQVTRSVLRESLLLGSGGTLLGIGIGLVAAFFLNRSLSRLLEVPMPAMQLSWLPFGLAVIFGLGTSLLGAWVPARRAGKVSPLEGMDRVAREDFGRVPQQYVEAGVILSLVSLILVTLSIRGFLPMDVAIFAGLFLLVGVVLLTPAVLEPLCRLVNVGLRPLSRVESGLALRVLLRHRSRSSLTVGVLFVAGAAGVGMASSILDNVDDVRKWYERAIVGDFFVRAMLPDMSTGLAADLPDALITALQDVPGVKSREGMTIVEARVGETSILALARDLNSGPAFDLVSGDPAEVRQQMIDGQVVIGSVLAQRLQLGEGDSLELETAEGKKAFRICAVTNDYLGGGLTVYVHRPVAMKYLGVEGYDGVAFRTDPQQREAVRERLQAICDEHGVLLHSNAEIIATIDAMIAGIDGCLWGLIVLVFVVASFGVVNTLTMNVLEQTRELGVLRIVAMTKRQVRHMILIQAVIMGVVGFTPGVLAGVAFAWVINLAMPAALGHPVEFVLHPWLVLSTLAAALAIITLAALVPAQRAANLDVCTALHYE